jgi:hypothetical protein
MLSSSEVPVLLQTDLAAAVFTIVMRTNHDEWATQAARRIDQLDGSLGGRDQLLMPTSSTSKISVEFGPMARPAPFSP